MPSDVNTNRLAPPPTAPSAGGWPRVLLVEDGLINQRVATALLEEMGCAVVLAGNGREALQQLETAAFDVALMDLQMPELDGLETTRIIRAREKQQGGHLPILAMTAFGGRSDHESCLEAGMDGVIAKPIRARELEAALAPYRGLPGAPPATCPPAPAIPTSPTAEAAIDWTAALAVAHGNPAVLRAVVSTAQVEIPGLAQSLRTALAAGDEGLVRRVAHTLKAALYYLAAQDAWQQAGRVEQAAQAHDLPAVQNMLPTLDAALGAVLDALKRPENLA